MTSLANEIRLRESCHNDILDLRDLERLESVFRGLLATAKEWDLIKDSRLIADIIYCWAIAFPDEIHTIYSIIRGPDDLFGSLSEGIVIGLVESANELKGLWDLEFLSEGLAKGSIMNSMVASVSTFAGSGRLTTALGRMAGRAWSQSGSSLCIKIPEALKRLETACEEFAETRTLTSEVDRARTTNFLVTFEREFRAKFYLASPLRHKRKLDSLYLEDCRATTT